MVENVFNWEVQCNQIIQTFLPGFYNRFGHFAVQIQLFFSQKFVDVAFVFVFVLPLFCFVLFFFAQGYC